MTMRVPLLPKSVRWSIVGGISIGILYGSVTSNPPIVTASVSNVERASVGMGGHLVATDSVGMWGHLVAYMALAYALAYAIVDWQMPRWHAAAFVIGSTILYGVGLEIVQHALPHRAFDVRDIAANTLGAILVLPWYLVRPYVELVPIAN